MVEEMRLSVLIMTEIKSDHLVILSWILVQYITCMLTVSKPGQDKGAGSEVSNKKFAGRATRPGDQVTASRVRGEL